MYFWNLVFKIHDELQGTRLKQIDSIKNDFYNDGFDHFIHS